MSKSFRDKERLKSKQNHSDLLEAHNNSSSDTASKQETFAKEKKSNDMVMSVKQKPLKKFQKDSESVES
ncbi:hypothetical protein [Serratia sp. Se-RSBMAAmG]|uniref:hypothetical protein n=1 Tax=Serratia sp. Se-RSBMAAmG TaxID=3043305 RepID=UPI0024AF8F2F|nr:hypothetical protein [Serratia sp. Se-RSBMAAmG]MDI6977218.1 hypothetical protein [Serratia sp. Se-RSBMAAmG]